MIVKFLNASGETTLTVAGTIFKGDPGAGINIKGTLTSTANLPVSGSAGDAYLIDGNLHSWSGSSWTNVGTIQGPKGDKGDTGAASTVPGPKGDKGDAGAASTVPGPKGDKGDTGPAPDIQTFVTYSEALTYSTANPAAIVFSQESAP